MTQTDVFLLALTLASPLPLVGMVAHSHRRLRTTSHGLEAARLRRELVTGVVDGALTADDHSANAWIAWCHLVADSTQTCGLPARPPTSERPAPCSHRGRFLKERAERVAQAMTGANQAVKGTDDTSVPCASRPAQRCGSAAPAMPPAPRESSPPARESSPTPRSSVPKPQGSLPAPAGAPTTSQTQSLPHQLVPPAATTPAGTHRHVPGAPTQQPPAAPRARRAKQPVEEMVLPDPLVSWILDPTIGQR